MERKLKVQVIQKSATHTKTHLDEAKERGKNMPPTLPLKAAFPDSHRWDLCWSVSWGCWGRLRPWFHPEGQNPGFQRGPWQSGRPPCPAAPVQQVVSTMRHLFIINYNVFIITIWRFLCCVNVRHIKYFNIITYIFNFEGLTLYICQINYTL